MKKPNARAQLVLWAITEIRQLDELCRGQVPGYEPLESDDMAKLAELKKLAEVLTTE